MTLNLRVPTAVDGPVRAGHSLGRGVADLLRWPVSSQHAARRNALRASTEIAQRRQEQQEVEDFLATRAHPLVASAPDPASAAPG